MCGIAGIFAYHNAANPIDRDELLRIRDHMIARGPDGFGEWHSSDQRVGLGHRRLSILDLSERAAQPMASADGKLIITFNGEIYNYRELRAALEAKGHTFRTQSDTEVLLHLYAEKGEAMLQDLRGIFAFGLWDAANGALMLARDPYGIKPLYYANDGWTVRFASQVKALLAGGRVSRDPAGIVGFDLFGSVPEPFTLYRDIRALPAGHWQWIDDAGPREPKPFANLAAVLAAGALYPSSPEELTERVRVAVLDSVRAHLLADVEVGVFLSAGVDSGALLGLMRDAGQGEVRAITLAFEEFRGTSEDEAPLAARVAERYQAKHVVRRVTEREFRGDLSAIFEAMDQPSIDGVNTWFVSKAAKEAGLKVALSGLGGDELLAGYPSFITMPRWRRWIGPLAAIPGLGRAARALIRIAASDITRAHPKVLGLLDYADTWPGLYLLQRGLFLPYDLDELMNPDILREGIGRLNPLDALASSLVPDPGSDVGRICALESMHYLRNQLLRDADWAGMAHGLEIRTPLVDTTLLKSVAPALARLEPDAGKIALAQAPSLPLPDEIMARTKTGFAVPTGAWMAKAAGIQPASGVNKSKGLESRKWSQIVLSALTSPEATVQ
jgi:asparagine synthase (glutamine-hydrolysing)